MKCKLSKIKMNCNQNMSILHLKSRNNIGLLIFSVSATLIVSNNLIKPLFILEVFIFVNTLHNYPLSQKVSQ